MDAVDQLLQSIPLEQILIQTINGIVTGMILALVASGLTLIFGMMDVVNFAHGELFMLGAYIGVLVLAGTGSFWVALVVATLMVALLGAALQIVTLRPRSAHHDSRDLRHLVGLAELCALAVRSSGAQDPGADHQPLPPFLS
jgi:branched-subunit amino acid ABC-type transport system permease component